MVLHRGDEDFLPHFDERPAVALGDEVDPLGGATNEDDLSIVRGVEKAGHLGAGTLKDLRGLLAQEVDPAMDIRVLRQVILSDRIEHVLRFLARGRVVEVDERFPVNLLLENGKVVPNSFDSKRGLGSSPCVRNDYFVGSSHSVSLACEPFWSLVINRLSSWARIGSTSIRLIISLANA